jgi:DNA-binding SARP family transcriptional activator/WD40 repeat protein
VDGPAAGRVVSEPGETTSTQRRLPGPTGDTTGGGPAFGFRILGPLEVVGPDGPVALGGPKQRVVLALLVVRGNAVVSAETLRESLWGDDPPESATNVVQSYVSHLRRAIGRDRIVGQAAGYRLRIEPDELDADRFTWLVHVARGTLAEAPEMAAATLEEALRLWRGPALADVRDAADLVPEAVRLEELRMEAEEARMEAYLGTGRSARAVGELEALVAAQPLRESLWALLIRALYAQGRQADALRAYLRVRRALHDELGIEPSPELARLQRQVLEQDPSLGAGGPPLRGYRLLERVRDTTSGPVYRALQPTVGRDVEIAIIGSPVASEPDFVRRFELAARAVASLEHPHIAPIHDFWREPGRAFVVSRHLRGGSLAELESSGTFTDPARAVRAVEEVASAVAYVHRQGLAHGALTADTVRFDGEGNAYLTAFAFASDPTPMRAADVRSLASLARRLMPDDAGLEAIAERVLVGVDAVGADEVVAAARLARGEPPVHPGPIGDRNPYKGLRAFDETDAGDFFGRSGLAAGILGRFGEPGPGARFVAIVGPSGSGKSSVARAGLLAAIRAGALGDPETLYVTDMVPGRDPFDELGSALARVAIGEQPGLLDSLESGPRGLLEAVGRILPPDGWLVLLVDQLEELFTLTSDQDRRDRFLESLRVAAVDPDARLHVIVTLRADFYDRPLQSARFGSLLATRTEAVPPLSSDEVEAVIRRPAERVGLRVEPGLVIALLTDLAREPGALPLLEFALTELFERREGVTLTHEAYRSIGGVSGAIADRAERTYTTLGAERQRVARDVFLRLVSLGEGRQDTRRRVTRHELHELAADPADVDEVLESFGRHRILTFDREPASREPTVEVAHESLLVAWPRLDAWVADARDDLRQLAQLSRAAAEWRASGDDPSFLLRGSRLERLAEWSAGTDLSIGRPERAFLGASLVRRDAELAIERERAAHEASLERRSRSRLRALVAVLAVAVVASSGLAAVAWTLAERAEREAVVSTARELAAAAIANLGIDPERAILLAMEAAERTRSMDGSVLPDVEDALHRAIAASRVVATLPGAGGSVAWGSSGSVAIETPTAGEVELRDASDWASTGRLALVDGSITDLAWSPDGVLLAVGSSDGTLVMHDTTSGRSQVVHAGQGPVGGLSFSRDGRRIAATWPDEGFVRVFDGRDGSPVDALGVEPLGATALSPDGRWLALPSDAAAGRVLMADLSGSEPAIQLDVDLAGDVAWSPDGTLIAVASANGAILLRSPSWEPVLRLGSATGVDKLAWRPDSAALAGGSDEGPLITVWTLDGDVLAERFELAAEETGRGIDGLAFSPDGTLLAAGAVDGGAVKVWDVGPGGDAEVLNVASTGFNDVALLPDGRHLLAVDPQARLRLFALADGTAGPPIGPPLDQSAFGRSFELSPDGSTVAIPLGRDGAAGWDVPTGQQRFHATAIGVVDDVAWAPDGRSLAVTTEGGTGVTIIDAAGRVERSLVGDDGVTALAARFDPSGRFVAWVEESTDGARIRVWDRVAGEMASGFPTEPAVGLTFDPAGRGLVTGFGPAAMHEVPSGERLGTLEGYPARVAEVAFDATGSTLAAAIDRSVGMFDPASGRRRLLLSSPRQRPVGRVAISPDGALVAAQSFGLASVWTLDIDDLLAIARKNVTRSLTDDECRRYLHVERCPATDPAADTLTP